MLAKMIFITGWLFMGYTSALAQQEIVTDPLGIEFVLVKPGSYISGRFQPPYPENKNEGISKMASDLAKHDASPGFKVEIKSAYYIGKYEITQEQWKKVMGDNPSFFQEDKVTDDAMKHPVDNVTWLMAQAFVKKLNGINKGFTYRLPTEFEWEYAARAGAADDISWAEIRLLAQMGSRSTQPIGKKKPNAWGLYDMLGNVWEWVHDYYNEKIFADPLPPKSGSQHVLKGASFVGDVKNATYMTHAAGPGNGWDIGLRIVMEVR